MSWEGSDALVWDVARLRTAADAAGVALWSWNVDTDAIALDERAYGMWGVSRNGPVTFEDLSARIHPEDANRARKDFNATRQMLGAYEIEFRILIDGGVKWISARGKGDDAGIIGRIMFGVFLDVTERKQTEELRELLAQEMSHRVKNLFSIASALTNIAARSAATTTEMARDLTQRLLALGRAHDLVRPVPSEAGRKAALLGDLLAVLLAPYGDGDVAGNRIRISVPELRIGEGTATTLALIVHELATNSIKYGALSAANGTLEILCTHMNGEIVIVWTEQGGPPATAPAGPGGFGSRLVNHSASGQLGGSITYDWLPVGLIVTLRMSKARLVA